MDKREKIIKMDERENYSRNNEREKNIMRESYSENRTEKKRSKWEDGGKIVQREERESIVDMREKEK